MRPSLAGYHTGKYSFDMFTHLRSTLDNPGLFVFSRCLEGHHLTFPSQALIVSCGRATHHST